MKSILHCLIPAFFAAAALAADPAEIAGKKIYECPYLENPPYGVMAWSTSDIVKNAKNVESRFVDYNSDAAKGLILDATAERDVTKDESVAVRKTSFAMAYNAKGWYIYIEGEEPLVKKLVDSLVDPKSPGRSESYEVFFTPGLHGVPYYQIMTRPYAESTSFVDWGMSHRHYRSLEGFAKVESIPLENGVGTFLFIPWESLYEWIPVNGDYWRFSIIRWMPFGKAGGVTWGGQVHDTGNFGLVHFQPATAKQKAAIEQRMLRIAWFKYLAQSKALSAYWSDAKVGDPVFYEEVLKPVVEKSTALGESLGDPETWNAESVAKARAIMEDWMEFNYKVAELRTDYLVNKRFAEVK
ncbi:MAG TPA: hypothetical protein PLS03_08730 [Terrimicrobiaceae bacterium]|nr:hypothetical protein [Terrimicrobiaceae bacterium]